MKKLSPIIPIIPILLTIFLIPCFAAHPPIKLKDINGKNILVANGSVQSNLPVSYEKSCNKCHNIDFINLGFHTQQGRLSILRPEVYDKIYAKYGKKAELPKDQSQFYSKYFGSKNLYGPGGMYNRISVPHMLKMPGYTTKDALDIDMTTAEWQFECAICHTGGGYALRDQANNRLDKMNMKIVKSGLKKGVYYTDYLVQNEKTGKFDPYDYHHNGITNVRENDCLICHATNGYDLGMERMLIAGKHLLGWANTIAANLGKLNKDGTIAYNAEAVKNFYKKIGATSDETCARCHASSYDEDDDGKITPNDNLISFPFLHMNNMNELYKSFELFASPGFFKRGHVMGNTVVKGSDGFLHKTYDKNANVQYYNPKTNKFEPVPFVGVHIQGDEHLKCSDCHTPVEFEHAKAPKTPSHDFTIGSAGFNVRADLQGTATCEQCHDDYMDTHEKLFGKNEEVHMKNIHCTVCHIPQKFRGVVHTLVEDKLTSLTTWTPQFANFAMSKTGLQVVPFNPDYVWYPHVAEKGDTPKLMIKPANAIAVLSWRLSDGRPVPNRFLSMVFKGSKMINPLTGKSMALTLQTGFEKMMNSLMKAPPLVTTKDEITFAAQALQDAIKKTTDKKVKVQYIYHLGILDGSYIISHNIAPISSEPQMSDGDAAYAKDPMHVLQCNDCHRKKGKFNRNVIKYPHIDDVPGITVFEVPKAAIAGYAGNFKESDLRRLTFAYFSPVGFQIFPANDGNSLIKAVWTPKGDNVNPLQPKKVDAVKTDFVPNDYQVEEAIRMEINNGTQTQFEVLPIEGSASNFKVFTNPSAALVKYNVVNGKLNVVVKKVDSAEITIAIAKK